MTVLEGRLEKQGTGNGNRDGEIVLGSFHARVRFPNFPGKPGDEAAKWYTTEPLPALELLAL